MNFWNTFVNLCNEINKSPNAVATEIGISSGSITAWKQDPFRKPQDRILQKIANYFNVSIEYLLGKENKKTPSYEGESNISEIYNKNIYMIPVFENVSAGFGTMAIDQIIDYEPLHISCAAEAKETILIKVKGDSMFPKIEDGDLIQVHKQTSVDSGSIAVIMIDGEDTLVKKIIYGETWIELHSINPMYKTIRFNDQDVLRVQILGLVKKIIKTC
ncbi:MAG: helix-turn-helix domain-containing protein [Clostridia bacterium]|nr:helix-turn-helix domain-containing protein [Clostridia bacterium]